MTGIQLVYTERDIEDILAADCEHYLGIKFLTRQYRTPFGVVDIIARHPDNNGVYYVVEIKKGLLDAAAFAQVTRYTRYLNSECSKDGKRLFVPLLVGETLSDDLTYVCEYLCCDYSEFFHNIGRTFYRLFSFDPMRGVTFAWSSSLQEQRHQILARSFCHVEKLDVELQCAQYQLYRLIEQHESTTAPAKPAIALVKVSSGEPS